MKMNFRQQAYTHIRRKMVLGGFAPGSRLSDVTLAKEIGISRTPVREAISQLESEGLVEQVPRFGAFVKTASHEELEEIFDLRELLEGFAAAQAARKITDEQLADLRRLLNDMKDMVQQVQAVDLRYLEGKLAQDWLMADVAFHMKIMATAGNRRMLKIASDFRIMTNTFLNGRPGQRMPFPPDPGRIYREHARLFVALKRRDPELAQRTMARHIHQAKERGLALYSQQKQLTAEQSFDSSTAVPARWSESMEQLVGQLEQGRAAILED